MPTWRGSLPEEEIWALVHFVDSLVAMKGTEAAFQLSSRLRTEDAGWTPPAEQPPQRK
jgi:hypothetical protein